MSSNELIFPDAVHVISRKEQTLILSLQTKKWVTLPTSGFEALRAYVKGEAKLESGQVEGIRAELIERTVEFLRREGFLTNKESRAQSAGDESAAEIGHGSKTEAAPRTLQLHVTRKCNLSCITCYVADFLLKGPDPLGFDDIGRLLEIAAANGFQTLTITGGEPLLRSDIIQILELARTGFSSVTLNTNGIALTEKICPRLKDLTDSINVSIDGADAATHDHIRGPGAFDRTMRGLENLKRSGYPMRRVSISPTVTRQNYRDLENVLDIADRFGADVSFGFFTPTGRGKCNLDTLMLDNKEMLALFERAAAKRRDKLGIASSEDKERALDRIKTDCNICSIVTVQADGSFFPCPNLIEPEHALGNYFSMSPDELLEMFRDPASKKVFAARTVDRTPGCADCECRYFCGGGCMANAYEVTGDVYGKDPYCGFYKAVWLKHGPLRDQFGDRAKVSPGRVLPVLAE